MAEITVSEEQMLQAVREVFSGSNRRQPLRRVLYTIYVRQAIEEGRKQADSGQTISHEKVMETMWKQIDTGLSGLRQHSKGSGKSSKKS